MLRESWHQLRLFTWPANATAARVTTLLLAVVVLAMLLLVLADGGFGAGLDVLSGR